MRGPRRTGAAIGWSIMALLTLFGVWVASFMGAAGWIVGLFFVVMLAFMAIRAYAAWTGIKRFTFASHRP